MNAGNAKAGFAYFCVLSLMDLKLMGQREAGSRRDSAQEQDGVSVAHQLEEGTESAAELQLRRLEAAGRGRGSDDVNAQHCLIAQRTLPQCR